MELVTVQRDSLDLFVNIDVRRARGVRDVGTSVPVSVLETVKQNVIRSMVVVYALQATLVIGAIKVSF